MVRAAVVWNAWHGSPPRGDQGPGLAFTRRPGPLCCCHQHRSKLSQACGRLWSVYAGHVSLTMLVMSVPPFKPTPLRLMYEQVAEHIAARIEAGELTPGTRMPPERDLATEYGVAYNTMRKATEILRERGLIITMHGRGTYVAERG